MRRRHRFPTTLSWSMLDVLAGGLGAMLLLMLLSYLESRQRGSMLSAELARAEDRQRALDQAQAQLKDQQASQGSLAAQLAEQRRRAADSAAQIVTLERQQARLADELKSARDLLAQAQADRSEADRLLAQTRRELSAATGQVETLEGQLTDRRLELQRQERRVAGLEKQLERDQRDARSVDAQMKEMESELSRARDRITALEADVLRWEKKAMAAGQELSQRQRQERELNLDLETLRRLLADQQAAAGQLRRDLVQAANRFAGIDLQGRRVILVVDRSGSMASVDSRSASPDKWPSLCRTVAHVLRSLPEAERFQLIVFSDGVEYPLGQPGAWLPVTPESPSQIEAALLRTEPDGNTNMYAALEAAFRFRPHGLDAIYLFSDGLPNVGPGLPPNPPPDEPSQSAILGRHLRDKLLKD
ncbi:MAG TPA: VWA domain-containing protein, partial [Gemmatales bacterium]|nr:VWA domain-containing protein [Gemmatales bacterium]